MIGQRRRSGGFTLIEFLMVLFIIGVILSILFPSLQLAREAARRTQCVNNLKQMSLAVHNYSEVHGVLPPGVVNDTGPIKNEPLGYHFGWVARILPYLEQGQLSLQLDWSTSVYAPTNVKPRSSAVSFLKCPSDRGPEKCGAGAAGNNYAGCHHDVEAPIAADNHGVFFLNSRIRYEDVPDGTSGTIFLGEKLRNGADLGWASGTRATLRNTGSRINAGDLLHGTGPIPSWNADGSTGGGPATAPGPGDPELVGGFSSNHPGGANFAFGDGSVRFLSESINRNVYRCLGHRADGELVDESAF